MVSDRIGDFIIRLQNAARVSKHEVLVPYSNHLFAISKKLKELGFLAEVDTKDEGTKKQIAVTLTFDAAGKSRIRGVKRISKPGRRLYVPHMGAHVVKGGTGVRLISSSAGVISDKEARKEKVGGEDLFEIW
jgi:small subunit ribosomal protein S8